LYIKYLDIRKHFSDWTRSYTEGKQSMKFVTLMNI